MKLFKVVTSIMAGLVLLYVINLVTFSAKNDVQVCNGSNIVLPGSYDDKQGTKYAGFPFKSTNKYDGYYYSCINPESSDLNIAVRINQFWTLKTWQGWVNLLVYSGLCYLALSFWGKRKYANPRH